MSFSAPLRIGIAQINCTVGDFKGNSDKIIRYIDDAEKRDCDIVVFPELSVCGYPPEDLVYKSSFLDANAKAIDKIAAATGDIIAIVGFVNTDRDIFNAAAVIHNRRVQAIYNKIFLPNYGVFDEERYFQKGDSPLFFTIGGSISCGLSICEDIWYPEGPGFSSALRGAEIIININASPFHRRKWESREKMLSVRAADYLTAIVYCNLVGGQDEIVFDGHSMVVDETGVVIGRAGAFREELMVTEISVDTIRTRRLKDPRWKKKELFQPQFEPRNIAIDAMPSVPKMPYTPTLSAPPSPTEEVYLALRTGLKDYFHKNCFSTGVIGLSGGIDSALVAAIAADALGKDNVTAVFMPSDFTSLESREDAFKTASNLGIRLLEISITDIMNTYMRQLSPVFTSLPFNTAEENLQARIRGNLLMALSNKFGWIVITTGNKSEMSTGYATLYGDMAGGFALLKDVPKTLVYEVARYCNEKNAQSIIPDRIFSKAPTAELRPGQRDQDSLPPYETLDTIIRAYVEDDRPLHEITAMGIDVETVTRTIRMIDNNEYKRRQAPPGVKITPRAFGKDRRMPITNRFSE